jgi:hypothetical protein
MSHVLYTSVGLEDNNMILVEVGFNTSQNYRTNNQNR